MANPTVLSRLATEARDAAPRTYKSAWQFGEHDTAVLLTAEDWLEEEADVDAALDGVEQPDPDPEHGLRAGNLCAIAKEITALRVERSLWAAEATRLASDLARARAEAEAYKRGWKLGVDVADVWYRASDDGLFWVAVCSDDQLVSHLASTDTTEKPNAR